MQERERLEYKKRLLQKCEVCYPFPQKSLMKRILVGDIEQERIGIEQHLVVGTRLRQDGGNVTSRFELTKLEESLVLLDGFTDEFSGFRLTLGLDNDRGLLLDSLVDQEGGTKSGLLCDLLGFDGVGEFGRERDVGNRNIIENKVETLARAVKLSRTNLETISRCVMSCEALN